MQKIINWHGIDIEIIYTESYSTSYLEVYGYPLTHIELKAEQPLPVTETGYRSLFIPAPNLSDFKTPEAFITDWLDVEADCPAWQQYEEQSKQYALF